MTTYVEDFNHAGINGIAEKHTQLMVENAHLAGNLAVRQRIIDEQEQKLKELALELEAAGKVSFDLGASPAMKEAGAKVMHDMVNLHAEDLVAYVYMAMLKVRMEETKPLPTEES